MGRGKIRDGAAALILAVAAALEVAVVPKDWITQSSVIVFAMTAIGTYLVSPGRAKERPTDETMAGPARAGILRATADRVRGGGQRTSFEIPHQPWFRGRGEILDELTSRHRTQSTLPGADRLQAVLLLMHGRPGIGKTATAWELVRLLQAHHTKLLYANLGNATEAQSSADVLRRFVTELGRPTSDGDTTAWRQIVFRSLTAGKGYLMYLDGVHDASQVADLMPGAGCTVIVASRRDLSSSLGEPSTLLDLPSADLALDMLEALAGPSDGSTEAAPLDAEDAADVVELCGRLPIAILSTAQRIQRGEAIAALAGRLRDEGSRLRQLSSGGRSFAEGLEAEFLQLSVTERKAFCVLELVESPTFVPWVLAPMLEVSIWEAESLAARLNTSGLLDVGDKDIATGLARYHMHPLLKLFAQEKLREIERPATASPDTPAGEITPWVQRDKAQERLEHAYKSVAARVLHRLEPGFVVPGDWHSDAFLPRNSGVPDLIREHPESWARAEFMNLLTCARNAYRDEEWALCARVASWLGGCVPSEAHIDDLDEMFEQAAKAAARAHELRPQVDGSLGTVDVLLAHSWSRIAVERYEEAFELLDRAVRESATASEDTAAIEFRLGRADLFRGEAFLQIRHRAEAAGHLLAAKRRFADLDKPAQLALARVLIALMNDSAPGGDVVVVDPATHSIDGGRLEFWTLLHDAEDARRVRRWDLAIESLEKAARHCEGDGRRQANVAYRAARVHLEHVEALRGAATAVEVVQRRLTATRAVRRSADSVRAFRRMGNLVGEVRARYSLVRAYVAAEQFDAADAQLAHANEHLDGLLAAPVIATEPLAARGAWARGVLLLARDRPLDAYEALREAHDIMRKLGDNRSARSVNELLRSVRSDGGPDDLEFNQD